LKKGAHVSVEGELRYREFVSKKQKKSKNGDQKIRVAEIHLSKIAKLDRAEKRECASFEGTLRIWKEGCWTRIARECMILRQFKEVCTTVLRLSVGPGLTPVGRMSTASHR